MTGRLGRWLLDARSADPPGPYEPDHAQVAHQQPWWKVMCLTGVDYFSTLGYQPGIAALAAGAVSPIATLVLVLLTLCGALPVYRRVAAESPHGEGSISMLERLLRRWSSKLVVLALLGFMATDFIITITLSAADAAAHTVQNPFVHTFLAGWNLPVTLLLVLILGAVFLRGFREAINIAVVLVVVYLALNGVVVIRCAQEILHHPEVWGQWREALSHRSGNPLGLLLIAVVVFPKLALGLSGFETGVAVMPLVKGRPSDSEYRPAGRIRNTRQLLLSAALIMSLFLVLTSLITTLLIPPPAFQDGGAANGRALAFLAHRYLGEGFGTLYDLSTIAILWFAGASAMAGLLNIVPRFLPRYGMAPGWTRATRPLVLVYTAISLIVTLLFKANVDAQGGAYATGVLVLMTSAAIAVTLSAAHLGQWTKYLYGLIALVFVYTTLVNMVERPEGLQIASVFIVAILVVSVISRIFRSTELRVRQVEFDQLALYFLVRHSGRTIRFIANHRDSGDVEEYHLKQLDMQFDTHLPTGDPVMFLEVQVEDASDFEDQLDVRGVEVGPYQVLQTAGSSVPNVIAALLLQVRDVTGVVPHVYFDWDEGSPIGNALRFLFEGEGDIPPLTHEVLRQAEPDALRRPVVHVGG